jgi:hypothetical protein
VEEEAEAEDDIGGGEQRSSGRHLFPAAQIQTREESRWPSAQAARSLSLPEPCSEALTRR